MGGFVWVFILSIILFFRGNPADGIIGLVLMCTAVVLILTTAPWKHPTTLYWKLMVPVYIVLLGSVAWAIWSFGGIDALGLNWWNTLWILLLLIPFGTIGNRRWSDSDT